MNCGPQGLDVGTNAADESATTDCHINRVRGLAALAQDLQSNGSLTGNHFRIIEWVDEAEVSLLFKELCFGLSLIKSVAMQYNFGA